MQAEANNDYDVDFDCIASNSNGSYFTTDFLKNLDSLPLDITDPSTGSSWDAYEIFFQKYGTCLTAKSICGNLLLDVSHHDLLMCSQAHTMFRL